MIGRERARDSPACRGRRRHSRSSNATAPRQLPIAPRPLTTSGRLRFAKHARGVLDVRRIRRNASRRLRREVFAAAPLRGDRLAQHVGRNLDIDRPGRLPSPCASHDALSSSRSTWSAMRSVRDRRVTGRMMSTCACPAVARDRPARRARSRRSTAPATRSSSRIRDRGHAVGDAGAGRDHRNAELARQQRMRVRHVHRRAFVAHVDDAHAVRGEPVPDRLDVAALQAEDAPSGRARR